MPLGTSGSVLLLVRRVTSVPVEFTSRCWKAYLRLLDRHPVLTPALNTCVMMASGDVIAQVLLEQRRISLKRFHQHLRPSAADGDYMFDIGRTLRFCLVGLTMAGPAMHVWYSALDRYVKGSGLNAAVHKVALDQVFFLPVYLAVFVCAMGALRADHMPEVIAKLRRDMPSMMIASYAIWPAAQLINFRFVPLCHRIFVINVVGLFWDVYIGWQAEKKLTTEVE